MQVAHNRLFFFEVRFLRRDAIALVRCHLEITVLVENGASNVDSSERSARVGSYYMSHHQVISISRNIRRW